MKHSARFFGLCTIIASQAVLPAADFTWGGGGFNNNWSQSGNWGGIAPPNDGTADLIFSGGNRPSPNADVAWHLNTLTFSSTSTSFTIGGQTLTFSTHGTIPPVAPLIINSSSNAHTINNSLVFNNNATLNASTGDLTFGGTSINNNGNTLTLTAASGRSLTLNTVLTGIGPVVKSGSGTATVNNTALYTGSTTISGGVLELAGELSNSQTITLSSGTLRLLDNERLHNSAALTMSSGTIFNVNGFSETLGVLSGAGSIQLGTNGALSVDNSGTETFSGVISGSGGSLTLRSLGTLILSGSNTYTGTTNINGGTLRLGASNRISDSSAVVMSSGNLDLNQNSETIASLAGSGIVLLSSDVANPGALTMGGNNSSTLFSGSLSGFGSVTKNGSGTFTLTGSSGSNVALTVNNGTLQIGNGSSTGSVSGNITNNAAVTFNRTGSLSYSGTISGSGDLNKEGSGTLTLNSANANTGNTTISGGTLQYGIANAIHSSSAMEVQTGATLNLNGHTSTLASLMGNGTVNLGTASLTMGGSGATTLFTGSMSSTGGSVLTKTGAGIFSLSGSLTNLGSISLTGGTLTLAGSERISNTTALAMSSGTTFNVNGQTETLGTLSGTGSITLGSGGSLIVTQGAAGTFSGVMSGTTGSFTKAGAETLTLSGSNTYTGSTIISAGTLRLGASNRISNSSALVLSGGWFDLDGYSETVASLEGSGVVMLSTNHLSPGALTFGGTPSTAFSGGIGGFGTIIKNGIGTFTLTGTATSNVGVTINNGTFEIGNGGTSGAVEGNITNLSNVSFNRSDNLIYDNVISGGGNFRKDGTGALTLTSAQAYTGNTIVADGTLRYGTNNALPTLTSVDVYSSGTLRLSSPFGFTFNATIGSLSGLGNVIVDNERTLTMGGNGGTTIFGGHIDAGSIYQSGTSNYGTIAKAGAGTFSLLGTMEGGLFHLQGGTLILADDERINASLLIDSGATFNLNGMTETIRTLRGNGTVSVNTAGATLRLDNENVGGSVTFSGSIIGNGSLTKLGANTVIFTDDIVHFGPTVISSGTMRLSGGNGTEQLNRSEYIVIDFGTLHVDSSPRSFSYFKGFGTVAIDSNSIAIRGGPLEEAVFSGNITGPGLIETQGTQTLAGGITSSGSTLKVSFGTLHLSGTANSGSVIVKDVAPSTNLVTLNLIGNERISDTAHVLLDGQNAILNLSNSGQQETTGRLTGTGTVQFAQTGTARLTLASFSEYQFDGRFSGSGGLTVSNGTMIWGGTQTSDHTGINYIRDRGTVRLAADNRFPTDAALVLQDLWPVPATFDLNGYDQTLRELAGQGRVIVPLSSKLILESDEETYGIAMQLMGDGRIYFRNQATAPLDAPGFRLEEGSDFTGSIHVNRGSVVAQHLGKIFDANFTTHVSRTVDSLPGEPRPTLYMGGVGVFVSPEVLLAEGSALNVMGGVVTAQLSNYPWTLSIDGTNGASGLRLGTFNDALSLVEVSQIQMWGDGGFTEVRGGELLANEVRLVGPGSSLMEIVGSNSLLEANTIYVSGTHKLVGSFESVIESSAVTIGGSGTGDTMRLESGATLQAGGGPADYLAISETGVMSVIESSITRPSDLLGFRLTTYSGSTIHFQRSTADFRSLTSRGGQIIVEDSEVNFGMNTAESTSPGIVFQSGRITFENSLTISNLSPLGTALNLAGGRHLILEDSDLTVASSSTLTLSGGSLTAARLFNNGSFTFSSGTLNLTGTEGLNIGSGGIFGPAFTLLTGSALNLPAGSLSVSSTATMTVDGGILDAKGIQVEGTLRSYDGLTRVGSDGMTVQSAGRVFASGTLSLDGAATNQGRITLQNGTGLILGNTINNPGVITGDGQIASLVNNQSSGELRGETGRTLLLSHPDGVVNNGKITVQNGTVEVRGQLSNTGANALISGRGTLIAEGGIINSRSIAFSSGITDIYGDVNNTGTIVTSGGAAAVTTFFDDVIHNGTEIRTSTGSSTVFLGSLSGSGPFTGTGTVFVEGDMRPGNSPGIMIFEGNLVLSPTSNLTFELGGDDRGTEYDAIDITGEFIMDGVLDVVLINSLDLLPGAVFNLFNWGLKSGAFDEINLPALASGLEWDTSDFEADGTITVAAPRMTYARWKTGFIFGASVNENEDSDPDGDGRENLLEYTFGTNPLLPDNTNPAAEQILVVDVFGTKYLALRYERPSGESERRTDVTEMVTRSTTITGTWTTDNVILHSISDDGTSETLIYRSTIPMSSSSSEFLRFESHLQ